MAKIIFSVLLVALVMAACGSAEEYLADPALEPSDFMGIGWGQDVSTVADLVETYRSEEGDMAVYVRSADVKIFGGVTLDSIEYTFIQDKLRRGALTAKGKEAEDALLYEAASVYGRETARVGEDYIWRFTDVNVMFSREPHLDQSVLFYIYLPMR